MGILLGLTAALSGGLADYFAALASRRAGSFRVVLGFHLVAMVLLVAIGIGAFLLLRGDDDTASPRDTTSGQANTEQPNTVPVVDTAGQLVA